MQFHTGSKPNGILRAHSHTHYRAVHAHGGTCTSSSSSALFRHCVRLRPGAKLQILLTSAILPILFFSAKEHIWIIHANKFMNMSMPWRMKTGPAHFLVQCSHSSHLPLWHDCAVSWMKGLAGAGAATRDLRKMSSVHRCPAGRPGDRDLQVTRRTLASVCCWIWHIWRTKTLLNSLLQISFKFWKSSAISLHSQPAQLMP